jgi:hypothetical protein
VYDRDFYSFAFGPDKNLYVITSHASTTEGPKRVDRYNGATGEAMGTFITAGSGGLASPVSLFFAGGSNGSVTPADAIVYPQLAVGGGYEVVLIVTNKSGTDWSGWISPLAQNGSLDYLKTQIVLKPGETKKFTLQGGAATVSSGLEIYGDPGCPSSALSVAYFFNYFQNGVLQDSTGVPKGQAAKKFTFPVERSGSVDTGLAIRRRANQSNSPITLKLLDANGNELQQATPGSDFARFFSEVFAGTPSQFLGSVVAESQDDFYLVVIRLETTPTGFQLTSVPAEAN